MKNLHKLECRGDEGSRTRTTITSITRTMLLWGGCCGTLYTKACVSLNMCLRAQGKVHRREKERDTMNLTKQRLQKMNSAKGFGPHTCRKGLCCFVLYVSVACINFLKHLVVYKHSPPRTARIALAP